VRTIRGCGVGGGINPQYGGDWAFGEEKYGECDGGIELCGYGGGVGGGGSTCGFIGDKQETPDGTDGGTRIGRGLGVPLLVVGGVAEGDSPALPSCGGGWNTTGGGGSFGFLGR